MAMMGMLMMQPTRLPKISIRRFRIWSRSLGSMVAMVTRLPPAQRPRSRHRRAELVSLQQLSSMRSSSGMRKCTVRPMLSISSRYGIKDSPLSIGTSIYTSSKAARRSQFIKVS